MNESIFLIIITLGMPSLPLVDVTADHGSVTLTIRTANAGVPPDNRSLKFNVKVSNENNEFVHDKNYSFPEYISDSSKTITVADLEPGDYTVTVAAINEYGSSPSSDPVLFTVPAPSSTTTVPPGENNDGELLIISFHLSIMLFNFNITNFLFFIFNFFSASMSPTRTESTDPSSGY